MVQEAVASLDEKEIADRTLSDLLFPLLTELSRPSRVTWRNDLGAETGGKPFAYKPLGKGARRIPLRLVLDEADPKVQPVGGYYNDSRHEIVLIVRHNPTVADIRETLFHEGIHLALAIMRSQGKAALGDEHDPAIESLDRAINKSTAIADMKNRLELLRRDLNISRKQRSLADVPATTTDTVAPELWEEAVVFAATSYLKLLRVVGTDEHAQADYFTFDTMKLYLEHYGFMTKADLGALTEEETKRIELLKTQTPIAAIP